MTMLLITELVEDVKYITEGEGDKKNLFIEGIFLQAGVKNRNGRMYDPAIMEREVTRYMKEAVGARRAYGELGHPSGPQINLDRVSHLIVGLQREGNNWIGKAKVTDTPMGNIARGLINDGAALGVSSRGLGSLKPVNGVMEVQQDFRLATAADIVADPSAPDAFVNGIMEGVEWVWNNGLLEAHRLESAAKYINAAAVAKRLDESTKLAVFNRLLKTF
jgi:hypothetical protein